MSELQPIFDFLQSDRDPREMRRALAVILTLQGYTHTQIKEILGVSSAFVSKWKNVYMARGIEAFNLGYKGHISYLTGNQKQEIVKWIHTQNAWSIHQLKVYLSDRYGVIFKSRQSYYAVLKAVGGKIDPSELETLDNKLDRI